MIDYGGPIRDVIIRNLLDPQLYRDLNKRNADDDMRGGKFPYLIVLFGPRLIKNISFSQNQTTVRTWSFFEKTRYERHSKFDCLSVN